MPGRSFAKTDPGLVRARNEDALFADDGHGLYVVADGVGGAAAGDLASRLVAGAFEEHRAELAALSGEADRRGDDVARRAVFDRLAAIIAAINDDVFRRARAFDELRGMMSTVTAVLLGRNAAYIAHVGDSRVYLLRDGHMDQLTVDHTLAEELIRAGRVRREDLKGFVHRNVLSRAIGERADVQPDLLYVDLRDGDELLLCSDGLSDFVAEVDILRAIASAKGDVADVLVRLGNDHGGGDNIAVIVVRFAPGSEVVTAVGVVPMIEHTEKLSLLGTLPFCQHLSIDERMKVLRYLHELVCEAGETVFAQGDEGQDVYLVVDGHLEVVVDGSMVNVLGPGSHFGEIALVSGVPRTASVVARERARLFRIGRDGFYDLGQKDQAIAVKMLWSFSQTLAKRVTELSQLLVESRAAPR